VNRRGRQHQRGHAGAGPVRGVRRALPPCAAGGLARALVLGALALAFPALVGFGDSAESRNTRGNRLYKEGKFDEALSEYRGAQVLGPELRELAFNAGNALFRKGELPNALREYEQASAAGDSVLAGNAFYNAGNAFMQMRDVAAAAESYRAALIENPADPDAKHNLELALRMLEEQENQQQDQDQQNQDEQGEEQNQGQEQQDQEQQDQEQRDQRNDGQDESEKDQQQDGRSEQEDGENSEGQDEQETGMSQEDAERLLDAIEESEKELQAELRSARAKQRKKVDKDW
jgi:Ca-activated chloride channel family protein